MKQTRNQKNKKKEQKKEEKGRGVPSGRAQEEAHGPAPRIPEVVRRGPSPLADMWGPHVISHLRQKSLASTAFPLAVHRVADSPGTLTSSPHLPHL
jgi:hypothetical protein